MSTTNDRNEWQTFTQKDLLLLDGDPQLTYRGRGQEGKVAIGWGQRKLGLTVIQFINYYLNHQEASNPIVVYAGAAPGVNIPFVARLYPQIEWHLYDPQKFGIEPQPNVHIYNGLFTNEIAKEWHYKNGTKGKDRYVLFLSDIRTASVDMPPLEIEQRVGQDMLYQQQWVQLIEPVAAQLKFRLPYSDKGVDVSKPVQYLDGTVFKQAWAKPTSTETRLVVERKNMIDGAYPLKQWQPKVYEDQMFHHNVTTRDKGLFYNPFYLENIEKHQNPIWENELINDWDSTTELTIWNDYLQRHEHKDIHSGFIQLSKLLTVHLSPTIKGITKTLAGLRNKSSVIIE